MLVKKGAIFDTLLKHMHHYSLAVLLIELLETQINSTNEKKDKQKMAWDNSDNSEEETHDVELNS